MNGISRNELRASFESSASASTQKQPPDPDHENRRDDDQISTLVAFQVGWQLPCVRDDLCPHRLPVSDGVSLLGVLAANPRQVGESDDNDIDERLSRGRVSVERNGV